jgi:hypothetical protein
MNKRPKWLEKAAFQTAVALSTLFGLLGTSGVLFHVVVSLYPTISSVYLACFTIPPGFLVGAALGQAGGNRFLRLWHGMNEATRRGFATRLTFARAPQSWTRATKRWLFTGDWLAAPEYDHRLPYVRIFVSGRQPASCAEEDTLWREILARLSGDAEWEAGANHREISYPSQLPGWARTIDLADGARELENRIGKTVANDWVAHLWRRAARQWPLLGAAEFPAGAKKEAFETHYLTLSKNREALIVVLRPASFAHEVEMEREAADTKNIAA